MKWKIDYSRDAEKFIERENIRGETREELAKFIKRTKDKDINVDAKKLKGSWTGYYSCLLYTSPSPRDRTRSRMPSSA